MDNWIDVNDRLPEEYEDVILCFCKTWDHNNPMYVDIGYRSIDKYIHTDFGYIDPTHWQPLPDPPT
ncbi:MAG: DUF551 domain-containing protein [Mycoplasma sp.]|nr:DUF551 domain-containing protein [Mycoplasma sp.]